MASPKPNLFLLISLTALVGFKLFCLVLAYDYARWWTDLAAGFFAGLLHALLLSPIYFLLLVPMIAANLFLFRKRLNSVTKLILLGLSPVIAIAICFVVYWCLNPVTDRNCFADTFGVDMPTSATEILSSRQGGGFTDASVRYYFRADSIEIKLLIAALPVGGPETKHLKLKGHPGWPDPNMWNGFQVYNVKLEGRFMTLVVDRKYSQVFASVSGI